MHFSDIALMEARRSFQDQVYRQLYHGTRKGKNGYPGFFCRFHRRWALKCIPEWYYEWFLISEIILCYVYTQLMRDNFDYKRVWSTIVEQNIDPICFHPETFPLFSVNIIVHF